MEKEKTPFPFDGVEVDWSFRQRGEHPFNPFVHEEKRQEDEAPKAVAVEKAKAQKKEWNETANWTFDDPRGQMDVLGELFPNSAISGLALFDALRKIDRSARRIAQNSNRYSEERMDKKLKELKGYLRGLLGESDCERLGVVIEPRVKSCTIQMPQENMPEKDQIHFPELIDSNFEQWFLLV